MNILLLHIKRKDELAHVSLCFINFFSIPNILPTFIYESPHQNRSWLVMASLEQLSAPDIVCISAYYGSILADMEKLGILSVPCMDVFKPLRIIFFCLLGLWDPEKVVGHC